MNWLNDIPVKITEKGRAMLLPANEAKDLVKNIEPSKFKELVKRRAAEGFRGVLT